MITTASLKLDHELRWFSCDFLKILEAYSDNCETSKMQPFEKIVKDRKPLTIFTKDSILDVCQDSEYASEYLKQFLTLSWQRSNFIKKETLAQVLLCEFCEISKNSFFYTKPPAAASVTNI